MNEVTFADLVQSHFSVGDISRIFRLRLATDTAATLFLMLLSPMIFRIISVQAVFGICGVVWIFAGCFGLVYFLKGLESQPIG